MNRESRRFSGWECQSHSRATVYLSVQETAKRWGHDEGYVRKLCLAGRVAEVISILTFEAFPNAPNLRFAWRIPANAPKPALFYTRFTEAQRKEIARRAS